jgi:hypothetical protein
MTPKVYCYTENYYENVVVPCHPLLRQSVIEYSSRNECCQAMKKEWENNLCSSYTMWERDVKCPGDWVAV